MDRLSETLLHEAVKDKSVADIVIDELSKRIERLQQKIKALTQINKVELIHIDEKSIEYNTNIINKLRNIHNQNNPLS